jgi:hypothetical protein
VNESIRDAVKREAVRACAVQLPGIAPITASALVASTCYLTPASRYGDDDERMEPCCAVRVWARTGWVPVPQGSLSMCSLSFVERGFESPGFGRSQKGN